PLRRGEEGDRIDAGASRRARGGADPLKSAHLKSARRWLVTGRVQGVGFRAFVERSGQNIGVTGWVRNLDDGRVEAYAVGTPAQLDELAARLHQGPPLSE